MLLSIEQYVLACRLSFLDQCAFPRLIAAARCFNWVTVPGITSCPIHDYNHLIRIHAFERDRRWQSEQNSIGRIRVAGLAAPEKRPLCRWTSWRIASARSHRDAYQPRVRLKPHGEWAAMPESSRMPDGSPWATVNGLNNGDVSPRLRTGTEHFTGDMRALMRLRIRIGNSAS